MLGVLSKGGVPHKYISVFTISFLKQQTVHAAVLATYQLPKLSVIKHFGRTKSKSLSKQKHVAKFGALYE